MVYEAQTEFQESIKGERLYALYMMALYTGMKRGELLALTWDKINFDILTVRVDRSLSCAKEITIDGASKERPIFKEPKTRKGIRTIPLPDSLICIIRAHRAKQGEEKFKAGSKYEDQNLVFCTDLGKPLDLRNISRSFRRLMKNCELSGVSFHSMRHTYATRLLEAQAHPKVVQELLGHADVTTTLNVYTHVEPEIKVSAANKLNFLLPVPEPEQRKA